MLPLRCAAEHVVSAPDDDASSTSSAALPPQLEASLDALTADELAAAVPRRICLFVEPSPFTCAQPHGLRRCLCHARKWHAC
jgi:hypothetical protein